MYRNNDIKKEAASGLYVGRKEALPISVGVWNYCEEITRHGFLFKTLKAR